MFVNIMETHRSEYKAFKQELVLHVDGAPFDSIYKSRWISYKQTTQTIRL